MQQNIGKERQLEGIQNAKAKGVKWGPKPKLNKRQIIQMAEDKESGLSVTELMAKYNIGKTSVYRLISLVKAEDDFLTSRKAN